MDKTETRGVYVGPGKGGWNPKKKIAITLWEWYGISKPLELQGPRVLENRDL